MPQDTRLLPGSEDSDDATSPARSYLPAKLRFEIHEAGVSITKSAGYSILIGRYNRQRPVDIDLGEYDGVRYGISRQHIEIIPRQDVDRLLVKDLHTENGSQLNGQPMDPGHMYLLQDGAELKLGALHMTVHFVE